jgi:ketosteroid isomerase-like protein
MEVRNFLTAYTDSLGNRDLEKIGASYLQGPTLVVYWQSQELHGWEAVQTQWEKVLQKPQGFKLKLSDIDIHVFGRFAWATANYQREILEEGKPISQEGHITYILEKKRANWYILHEHATTREN